MLDELGDAYAKALRSAWTKVPGAADLVCYWFAKAWDQMAAGKLQNAGFVATNSIRGGANREVLKPIVDNARIFQAWSDEPWTVDGAAVRVSLVCFDKLTSSGVMLNGLSVDRILSDITTDTGNFDLTKASKLPTNLGLCIRGIETGGPFEIGNADFAKLSSSPTNPSGLKNDKVLKRIFNGNNILKRADERYVIDFGDFEAPQDASLFELPYHFLEQAYDVYAESSKLKKAQNHCTVGLVDPPQIRRSLAKGD